VDGCASELLQLRVSVQELAAAEREVADMMSDCLAILLVSQELLLFQTLKLNPKTLNPGIVCAFT
jgi:hypothetical protein